tara:strand:- start:15 stop:494 length:480 start_codon:yes stop_codon:yes gene_type:complete
MQKKLALYNYKCNLKIWTTNVIKITDVVIMSKMSDKPEISNAEFEVLDVLWDDHPATSNEVIARLNDKKDWHEKTVKTLLGRLVKKEVLGFEKQQRQYLYYPLIAKEDYTKKETTSFVSRLFKGKIAPMVAGFANQNSLSKQDVDELKALIKKWEENND